MSVETVAVELRDENRSSVPEDVASWEVTSSRIEAGRRSRRFDAQVVRFDEATVTWPRRLERSREGIEAGGVFCWL